MNRNEQIKTFDLEFETFELQSEHSNYNQNIRITIKTFELQSKHSNYNQNIRITIKTFELDNQNIWTRQSKHSNQMIVFCKIALVSRFSCAATDQSIIMNHDHPCHKFWIMINRI